MNPGHTGGLCHYHRVSVTPVNWRGDMIKQTVLNLTTMGFRRAGASLLQELRVLVKHLKALRKAAGYQGTTGLKLNLGCGPNLKKGWINIDLNREADLTLDLREGLPFADQCCAMVYSEHLLEHFDYPECARFLVQECYRVLERGGVFSVGVPDARWPLLEYAGVQRQGYFERASELWHPEWCGTEMEHLNYHFRQGGEHRFAYDFITLEKLLAGAGFVEITHRSFDAMLDSQMRALGTLYVDARKPAEFGAASTKKTGHLGRM